MNVLVRALRQFHEGAEDVILEKAIVLPDVPTMGTRVDLRGAGVEVALTVVGVTMRAISDSPGIRPPAGWRDQTLLEPA
jgi:hypothetical protein